MQMLDPGALGSPTTTIFEVVGKVEFVPASQAIAGPSQTVEPAKQKEPVRIPERGKTPKRAKSPAPERTRSSTPKCATSPVREKVLEALARTE